MSVGEGKTAEAVIAKAMMLPERIVSATVYWNGKSITFGSGIGIDTQPYDDCVIYVGVGTFQGAVASLLNSVYESATDDPTTATLVTGASFTTIDEDTDDTGEVGAIKCKDQMRYLFLRTEAQGTPLTVDFGALIALGRADSQAVSQTLVFDV